MLFSWSFFSFFSRMIIKTCGLHIPFTAVEHEPPAPTGLMRASFSTPNNMGEAARGTVLDPDIVQDLYDTLVTKYFFLGAATLTYYDHVITFGTELQVIWKRPKTYLTFLFLFTRYYAPLSIAVVAFAYLSPGMTREMCDRWIHYLPFGLTIPLNTFPAILMSIRVYALYNRNKIILGALLVYLIAQTAAALWEYTVPGVMAAPQPLDNYEFHFCTYLAPKHIGRASIMYLITCIVFDSLVFLLTIARSIYVHSRTSASVLRESRMQQSLFVSLVRDGVFYFATIFSVNLVWVLMILYAPTGLRAAGGVPSGCVITTMICRITLNLRSAAYGSADLEQQTGIRGRETIPLTPIQRRAADDETEFDYAGHQDDASQEEPAHTISDVMKKRTLAVAG